MNMFLNVATLVLLVLTMIETIKTKYNKVHIKISVITIIILCFLHTCLKLFIGICMNTTSLMQLITDNVSRIDMCEQLVFTVLMWVLAVFVIMYIHYRKKQQ